MSRQTIQARLECDGRSGLAPHGVRRAESPTQPRQSQTVLFARSPLSRRANLERRAQPGQTCGTSLGHALPLLILGSCALHRSLSWMLLAFGGAANDPTKAQGASAAESPEAPLAAVKLILKKKADAAPAHDSAADRLHSESPSRERARVRASQRRSCTEGCRPGRICGEPWLRQGLFPERWQRWKRRKGNKEKKKHGKGDGKFRPAAEGPQSEWLGALGGRRFSILPSLPRWLRIVYFDEVLLFSWQHRCGGRSATRKLMPTLRTQGPGRIDAEEEV